MQPIVDLAVSKAVSYSIVYVGDTVVWTVTVVNYGFDTGFNCVVNEYFI